MGKTSLRASIIAGALLFLASAAHAAGLGKLTVLSHLGEPLSAEIDVVAVEKGELETLAAHLASPDAYIQSNLPYPSPSLGLQMSVEQRSSGGAFLRVTSTAPISEPFVDLLVELNWTGGKILRAYTALLDPPAFASAPPAASTPPAAQPARPAPAPEPQVETKLGSEMQPKTPESPASSAGSIETPSGPAPSAQAPAGTEEGTKAEKSAAPKSDSYGPVKRGDTLSKIAKQFKTSDVTMEQMLVLLYRSNKSAFNGNMNRMKTGKVLTVPDAGEASAVSPKDARKEVRLQTADFNAFRERLASASGDTSAAPEQSGQSSAGRVTGPVADKSIPPASEPKEVLKLSKGEAPGGNKAAQARVHALEEEVAARDKTVREANERIAKLEKTVKDMQALTELKSKSMADAQKSASPQPKPEAVAPSPPVITPPALAPTPSPTPSTTSPSAMAPTTLPAPTPAPMTGPMATSGTQPEVGLSPPARPSPKPRPRIVQAPEPAPQSFIDQALSEPMYLAAGVGVLAVLGFLAYRMLQSRRAVAEDDELEAEKKTSDVGSFAATGTDTAGAMAAAARAAQAQIAEEVDPLAEAEIYLAYGRDNQAEEILKEALQSSSRKPEIQLKLLEIYAKRRDVAAFEAVSRDLHTSTGGKGDLWHQAARLGYQLDPANSRYIAGKPTGAEAAAAAAAAAAATDKTLDFQVDALEPNPEIGTLTDIDAGFGRRFATANANAVNTRVDLNVSIDDGQAAGTQTDIDLGHLDSPAGPTAVDLDLDSHGTGTQRAASNTDFDLSTFSGGDTTQIAPMDFRLDTSDEDETQTHSEFEKADSVDFDFKLDETETGTIGLHAEDGSDFDIDEISLDSGPTGKSEPVLDLGQSGPAIPEIDLSGISLDLGGDSGTATEGGPREDHWYDVQTKFDLAKAYQEMGDKEGAREILREVMAEGDATQKAAAEKVLQALS